MCVVGRILDWFVSRLADQQEEDIVVLKRKVNTLVSDVEAYNKAIHELTTSTKKD